tara:strand:- start:187 stop:777 length:591 start_codon:yes stop_codon:yes gene_type:complete
LANSGVFNIDDINFLRDNQQYPNFGQLELIQTQTASSVSALDFTNIKQDIYDVHFVTMPTMETNSTGHPQASKMQLRFSNDGGSSYESGASAYQWANQYAIRSGSGGESKDSADSSIEWTPRCNNGEPTSGYMYLYNLGDSSKYSFTTSHTTLNVDQGEFFFGCGLYSTAETINAIRFYNDYSMTGSFSLYGIRFA